MHKAHIIIIALLLSAVITSIVVLFSQVTHSDIVGLFYFPAIFLAVIISGGNHSPSVLAGWSAFLSYTILYLFVFIVVYALLLEMYLLRQVIHHVDEARKSLANGETFPQIYLGHIGNALKDLEQRRRKHFVLEKIIDDSDLSRPPYKIAANAIVKSGKNHHVRKLLSRLEEHIRSARGADEAGLMMNELINAAHKSAEDNSINVPINLSQG